MIATRCAFCIYTSRFRFAFIGNVVQQNANTWNISRNVSLSSTLVDIPGSMIVYYKQCHYWKLFSSTTMTAKLRKYSIPFRFIPLTFLSTIFHFQQSYFYPKVFKKKEKKKAHNKISRNVYRYSMKSFFSLQIHFILINSDIDQTKSPILYK